MTVKTANGFWIEVRLGKDELIQSARDSLLLILNLWAFIFGELYLFYTAASLDLTIIHVVAAKSSGKSD